MPTPRYIEGQSMKYPSNTESKFPTPWSRVLVPSLQVSGLIFCTNFPGHVTRSVNLILLALITLVDTHYKRD